MGAIISRFRKSKTTIEILEEIDKNISHLEKFRRANQELRQKVIGKLILYSVLLYIGGAIALYFFFMPQEWTYKIYGLLPFFLFPFLVYLLKRFLHWFFVRKISQNEGKLQELTDKRKDILENVMETETYKKAKEILEKFDPETKRKIEEEKKRKENEAAIPQTQGLRKRNIPQHHSAPGSPVPMGQGMVSPGMGRGMPTTPMQHTPLNGVARGQNLRQSSPVAVLPRPILPLSKSTLDKLMEYMIGDGTAHRYALICKNCCNHNGMALKEEFEYLAFRCAYCRFFNPARKQRPNAPMLPMPSSRPPAMTSSEGNDEEQGENNASTSSTPEPSVEGSSDEEKDAGQDVATSRKLLEDESPPPSEADASVENIGEVTHEEEATSEIDSSSPPITDTIE